ALVREDDQKGTEAAPDAGGAPTHRERLLKDPNVAWFPARDDAVIEALAFDHAEIVRYALWRLRNKVEYGSIAHRFLGPRFTLAQVQEVYEAVLDRRLDAANFRRHLRGAPGIEATDEYLHGGKHRPPRLYRYAGDTAAVPQENTNTEEQRDRS
ncbi:MAG: hypothetical protein L0J68_11525, partial [Micrococcaceae bacterium]|nr:hypothetical protein [Micrococcaceae bacterium]